MLEFKIRSKRQTVMKDNNFYYYICVIYSDCLDYCIKHMTRNTDIHTSLMIAHDTYNLISTSFCISEIKNCTRVHCFKICYSLNSLVPID